MTLVGWEKTTPFSVDVLADPYAWYSWLREQERAHHIEELDLWVIHRYDDVAASLRAPHLFSSQEGVTFPRLGMGMMITADPPDHTRLRKIVSRHFTPAAIEARRPQIEKRVREFVDPIVEAGTAEFVDDLATPLPTSIIADMLGVSADDRQDFKQWSDDVVEGFHVGRELEGDKIQAAARGFSGLGEYLQRAIAERRRNPGDDLVSLLVAASDEERLSAGELTSFCVLLLVAGNETTTNLLGSLVLSLIESPEQWQLLRDRPALLVAAIEEALRFRSPIKGLHRTALTDVEIDGRTIPERARVLLLYAAANRDDTHFTDADRFIIERHPNDHLGFGAGIHFCLGAALARIEALLTLQYLMKHVEAFELAGDVAFLQNPNIYGPRKLPIALRTA